MSIGNRIKYLAASHVFDCIDEQGPEYLQVFERVNESHHYNTSHSVNALILPKVGSYGIKSLHYIGAKIWNSLPDEIQTTFSRSLFKVRCKNISCQSSLSHNRRVAKCQNYTFDGVFRYKSSSMLIHLYIGWALAYGWMTCLLLLHEGILGHFMQKITKKVCFLGFPSRKFIFRDRNSKLATNVFKRMLLIIEHVALV